MNRDEIEIYIKQFIESYRWYGRLYPTLDEVRELMPRDGVMYERLSMVMEKLSDEINVKNISAELGIYDVRMTILHTAVAAMEKKGIVSETALDLMEKELADLSHGKVKRTKVKKNRSLLKMYEGIQGTYKGKKREKSRNTIREAIRKDINTWMLGMSVYTEIVGADSALRMTEDLVDDVFRLIIKRFETRLAEEGVDREICLSFMHDLDIPEAGLCMLRCFMRDDFGINQKRTPGGTYLHVSDMVPNRRKSFRLMSGRGAGMMAIVMLMGIMITGMMSIKNDDKETRLRQAMTGAMQTTVEKMDDMDQTNALMAVFMQRMLSLVDDDVDLTVRICELDKEDHELEVEAVGEFGESGNSRRRVAVRRRISF